MAKREKREFKKSEENSSENFEINETNESNLTTEMKTIDSDIKQELVSKFSLPKYGLENRTMNVMARIDEKTSVILDALVALELAPSRSAAAAYLISEGILSNKQKYLKILESYEIIKKAKESASYSFHKAIKEEE